MGECDRATEDDDRSSYEEDILDDTREGEDERTGGTDEEHDSNVEQEGRGGIEDENGQSHALEYDFKGSCTLEKGNKAGVQESAHLVYRYIHEFSN